MFKIMQAFKTKENTPSREQRGVGEGAQSVPIYEAQTASVGGKKNHEDLYSE